MENFFYREFYFLLIFDNLKFEKQKYVYKFPPPGSRKPQAPIPNKHFLRMHQIYAIFK